ncbi:MAG: PilZ domain-containing protein [Caldisericia bacterium]
MDNDKPKRSLIDKIYNFAAAGYDFFFGGNMGPHRTAKRVKISVIVAMVSRTEKDNGEQYNKAALLNFSETGVCLECSKMYPLQTNVYLMISLPSHQQYLISGTITRVEDLSATYLYGMSILPLYQKEVKEILHYFRVTA